MRSARLQALQSSVAQEVYESIEPTGWQKAVLNHAGLNRRGRKYLDLVFADGRTERVMKPPTVLKFADIRDEMATPEYGAWFSAVLTVSHDRSYSYDFNYDDKPDWGYRHEPSIEDYLADRESYPRPGDKFPSWYPTLDTFRAELAADLAELAEGIDWTQITVRCVNRDEGELRFTAELSNGESRILEYDEYESDVDLISKSSELLGAMFRRGLGRWWAYSVDERGGFEFLE
ncbi:hypothetical protein [Mycolicibacterium porcinum]|uniref:Uncharacterized protein n=1 Tax=Mycolicibacterium porcinum TaxID=39693 RepID=A0ABV3VC33_9MYCO